MRIGINMMSTIGAMRRDFEGTVKRLSEGGCSYFEVMSDWGAEKETIDFYANLTGGPSGWDPDNTLRRLEVIRQYGMDIRGIFVFDSVILQQADQLGQYCRDAGIRYIVFSFLDYGTIDDIYSKIETVRHTAGILGQYGVRVLQHNHEHDTALITDRDGKKKPIIDVFLEQLSPEELMLEVDTGWIKYAGLDPAEYIREKAERIMILHLKDICHDFREVSRDKIFVPCGAGAVDFQAVMDAIPADRRDSMLYVIDQDASGGDIVDDLITGMQYLNGLHM